MSKITLRNFAPLGAGIITAIIAFVSLTIAGWFAGMGAQGGILIIPSLVDQNGTLVLIGVWALSLIPPFVSPRLAGIARELISSIIFTLGVLIGILAIIVLILLWSNYDLREPITSISVGLITAVALVWLNSDPSNFTLGDSSSLELRLVSAVVLSIAVISMLYLLIDWPMPA